MAYTPINWQTGDTITAEKLNRCDNGWSVTSGTTTLCDETVTTQDDDGDNVAYLSTSETITAETIDVTFAGTKYTCAKSGEVYGGAGFDFSVYPFMLYDDGTIYTETAGTYTVKVEAVESAVEMSAQFAAAVVSAAPIMQMVEGVTIWQEVNDALASGSIVYVVQTNQTQGGTVYNYGYVVATTYNNETSRYIVDVLFAYSQSTAITRYSASYADDVLYPEL